MWTINRGRARWYRSCHGATIGAMLISPLDDAMAEDSFADEISTRFS
jgi:hypothetical protein